MVVVMAVVILVCVRRLAGCSVVFDDDFCSVAVLLKAPLVAHTVELFPQYFQTHIRFPDGSRSKAKKVTK